MLKKFIMFTACIAAASLVFGVDYDKLLMDNVQAIPQVQRNAEEINEAAKDEILNPYRAEPRQPENAAPEVKQNAASKAKTAQAAPAKDTVVVTARQVPEILGAVPRAVELTDTSAVPGAYDFASVAGAIPGLSLKRYGPYQGASTVSLRGAPSKQALVMLNGITVNDIFAGSTDMSLVDVYGDEVIETVKGGMSSVYGADAAAGAINIVTKRNTGKWFSGSAFYGSNYTQRLQAGSSNKIYGAEYTADIAEEKSPGFMENSDYAKRSGRVSVNFGAEMTDTTFSGYYINREAGLPVNQFGATPFARQFDEQYGYGITEYIDFESFTVKADGSIRKGDLKFKNPAYGMKDSHVKNETKGSMSAIYDEGGFFSGLAGYEYKNSEIDSTKAGKKMQSLSAMFINATIKLPPEIFVNGGLRVDSNSAYGRMQSYSAGVKLKMPQGYQAYASVESSFSAPTFGDLYWDETNDFGGFYLSETKGNPGLKPETSISYEGGINYENSGIKQSITVFRRSTKDLITWLTETDGYMTYDRSYPVNIGKSVTTGIEAKASYVIFGSLDADVSYVYLDNRDMATGKKLPYSPEDTVSAALTYNGLAGIKIKGEVLYVDVRQDGAGIGMEEYWLLNLSAAQSIGKDSTLLVKIENALDNRDYMVVNRYPMQGRLIQAGISTAF